MPSKLSATCERAGLAIVDIHPKKWSVGFRKRWRAEFALAEVDWQGVDVEWDILGTDRAPALQKRAAQRRYDEARPGVVTAFVTESLNFAEVYEVRGALPDHSWWRREIGPTDLYIVEGTWLWSFVMTHEETGMGIGPFFVARLGPPGQ